jgi:SAM-dependent methyltransferase
MDRVEIYNKMAERKFKPKDLEPYDGNNGRVNRCVELFRSGELRIGGTLMDVGGGIGDLGYAVRDLFDKRIVVDISAKNLEAAAKKGNHVILSDVDKKGLFYSDPQTDAPEWIDVITALDFIEHIVDPESFAMCCFQLLKPGGQIFINTPNIEFWRHIELLAVHGRFPHTSGDTEVYHGGHLAFYCFDDMKRIFRHAGFTKFKMFKDEEGYWDPPQKYIDERRLVNYIIDQQDFVEHSLRLGCPNLLFRCEKPE